MELGDGVFALEDAANGRSLKMLGPGIRSDSDAGPFPFSGPKRTGTAPGPSTVRFSENAKM